MKTFDDKYIPMHFNKNQTMSRMDKYLFQMMNGLFLFTGFSLYYITNTHYSNDIKC